MSAGSKNSPMKIDYTGKSRTLSQEAIELAEHKIYDRVETKIFARAKIAATLIGILIAVLGVFGTTLLVDSMSISVREAIKSELKEDAAVFRAAQQKTLIEQQLAAS